jgi:phosphoglycerate kinase
MKTIKQLDNIKGKTVIVRVDFNVPFTSDDEIRDDNRIVQALPTINELLKKQAKVILLSHLGKINHKDAEKTIADKKKNSLEKVSVRLSELLKQPVTFCPETRGEMLKYFVKTLENGTILLVQNTRFEKGEQKNDSELSKEWADIGEVYVMDAFGSAHRAHASTYGIPEIMKQQDKPTAIGYLVEKEVVNLMKVVNVEDNARPYVAVLGGLKVSDKIKVIESLLNKCDRILIGGAMAYTFAKALGSEVGDSPFEEDQLEYARNCIKKAAGKIILPIDCVVSDKFSDWTQIKVTEDNNIPSGFMGMDIGPKTIRRFKEELATAKTIFWNGPMGVFEQKEFTDGTKAICEAVDALGKKVFSVCGGGDSAAAVKQFGYFDIFSHVSTGGGASLEMIENDGHLPGIDIIGD